MVTDEARKSLRDVSKTPVPDLSVPGEDRRSTLILRRSSTRTAVMDSPVPRGMSPTGRVLRDGM